MGIFKSKKQNQEYLIPPSEAEEFQLILKDANKHLITSSMLQPKIQILTTSSEIKHLKKQFCKFSICFIR